MTALSDLYEQRCATGALDMAGHLQTLHRLVLWLDAQSVIELGVRSGNSTVALLAALEQTGGRLWSCDIRDAKSSGVPRAVRDHPRWTFHLEDDLEAHRHAPSACDLLFIDTSHTLLHTRRELALYGDRASVIVLHDTQLPGVKRAVREWLAENPRHGYVEATRKHGLGVILT